MEDCDYVRSNLASAHLTMLFDDDGQQKCVNRKAKVNLMFFIITKFVLIILTTTTVPLQYNHTIATTLRKNSLN